MSFFNDEVREELKKTDGGFYDLEQGQNQFRIVVTPVWGYKYNFENRGEAKEMSHPFYAPSNPEVKENKNKLALNAAMVIYDYSSKQLRPFNIHQKKILNAIDGYEANPKYGDVTGYDVIVGKTGEGRETRYEVMVNPPEDMPKEVKEALKEVEIDMENVFVGDSPIIRKE